MKNYEIVEVGKKSIFKTTLYMMLIPMSLMAIVGLILTIVGIVSGNTQVLIIGIPYLIMPVIMLFIYALLSMLTALVYNKFAKKFGGLELKIIDKSGSSEHRE